VNAAIAPKLIAVDCDGTLFDINGYPSSRTCAVVQQVVDAGHQIVAATGRSRYTAAERLESIPGMQYLVCSNGAYVWDVRSQAVSWESTLPTSHVSDIISQLRSVFDDVAFCWEAQDGFGWDASFAKLAGGIEEMELGGAAQALGTQALYKLKVRHTNIPTAQLHQELVAVLGGKLCEITTSGAPFLELSAAGVHKGSGLDKLASLLGFTAADTIAFGDNHNDLPMFHWAGTAVAMGNALDEVKSQANAITLCNAEHGVAYYLEKLIDAGKL